MTQEELALESGTNAGYISRIELGRRKPSIPLLERIAAALNTTIPALCAATEGGQISVPEELANQIPADFSQPAVQLRQNFRELTPENQQLVIRFVRMLIQSQREEAVQ